MTEVVSKILATEYLHCDGSGNRRDESKSKTRAAKSFLEHSRIFPSPDDRRKGMNRLYAKQRRSKEKSMEKELQERYEEGRAIIQMYKKMVCIMYKKMCNRQPRWQYEIIEWFSISGGNRIKGPRKVKILLPQPYEGLLEAIGNNPQNGLFIPGNEVTPLRAIGSQKREDNHDDDSNDLRRVKNLSASLGSESWSTESDLSAAVSSTLKPIKVPPATSTNTIPFPNGRQENWRSIERPLQSETYTKALTILSQSAPTESTQACKEPHPADTTILCRTVNTTQLAVPTPDRMDTDMTLSEPFLHASTEDVVMDAAPTSLSMPDLTTSSHSYGSFDKGMSQVVISDFMSTEPDQASPRSLTGSDVTEASFEDFLDSLADP